MKYHAVFTLIVALYSTALHTSCNIRRCTTRIIKGVEFSRETFSDTQVMIVQCKKGTGFKTAFDSSRVSIFIYPDASYRSGSPRANFWYDFNNTDCDYLIRMLPSGETHRLEDIEYGKETYSGYNGGAIEYCSYSYTVDGQPSGEGTRNSKDFIEGARLRWH